MCSDIIYNLGIKRLQNMGHMLEDGVNATSDSWYRVEICDGYGSCCQGDRIGNLTAGRWNNIDNSACSHVKLGVTGPDFERQVVSVSYEGVFMLGSLGISFENNVHTYCGNPLPEIVPHKKVLRCTTLIYH